MKLEDEKLIKVISFLQEHEIIYILHKHQAVFTCEEANKYCGNIPGMHCKNLFLHDKSNNRFFIVILSEAKKLNFIDFAKKVATKKVSFGESKLLEEKLKLQVGSVSLFGILNDEKMEVELCIDNDVYSAKIVSFHPNINTATIELSQEMFYKFLKVIKRNFKVLEL